MTTLIVYGTVEGQTEKVAQFIEALLIDLGENVQLVDTADLAEDLPFDGVDLVILPINKKKRRHGAEFEAFLASNDVQLAAVPTLLLSVSLSAAFAEGEAEAQEYVEELCMRTGLQPDAVMLVPGAIRTKWYGAYEAQVLEFVVLRGQENVPADEEHEFTDWDALADCVTRFTGTAAA